MRHPDRDLMRGRSPSMRCQLHKRWARAPSCPSSPSTPTWSAREGPPEDPPGSAAASLVLIMLTACGSGGSNGPGGERNAPDSIAVLAESSLKEAFTKIAQQLEGVNAGKTAHHTERATPSGRHRA